MSNVTIEEIRGLPAEILETKNATLIAQFLPTRISIVSKEIGVGTILAVMAPYGGDFLNALESLSPVDSNVKWSLKLIERGEFDIGHPVTRSQLLKFISENPTLSGPLFLLLKVAEIVTPVSEIDVRKVCWSDNGEWLI